MLKKHIIPAGIAAALILLFIATTAYPGGNQHDAAAPGFSWQHNYLSNLFNPIAVNGAPNAAMPWAIAGMFALMGSFALFFIQFSKKIPDKTSAKIIKYFGATGMLFAFLAVTPYHDLVITIGATPALVSIFYIAVFVFRTRLHLHKVLCILYLLAAYACMFIYYTRIFIEVLPIMQKLAIAITIAWVLSLQYFSTAEDFKMAGKKKKVGVQL